MSDKDDDSDDLVKMHSFGRGDTAHSNVVRTDEHVEDLFEKHGAIKVPLDPRMLCDLFEMSGPLRTNIDSYVTNIDGYGHKLEAVVDLEDSDTIDRIRESLAEEKLRAFGVRVLESASNALGELPEVTDAEVKDKLAEIERDMARERVMLEAFFDYCCLDESFTSLRTKTRQDMEATGNAYWEVLRNRRGEVVQFTVVPSHTMRLLASEKELVETTTKARKNLFTVVDDVCYKRFRRFIQIADDKTVVFFKEYGDTRTYSAKTGKMYKDADDLKRNEPDSYEATEILHHKIHNPRSPYGVPRWVSELVAVLGSRNAAEVNLLYFQNRSVPPLAILVSGGRLAKSTVERLETYVRTEIQGKDNFHKIMVLEAVGQQSADPRNQGRMSIALQPLTDAQNHDAQFLTYMEKNSDAIGNVFRLPRLLRGDARDFNRGTAQASLEFAEQQVFSPLRKEFDFIMNRRILAELGVKYWRFVSKGPDFKDPAELSRSLNETARAGYLTPQELRDIAETVFDREFPVLEQEDWTKRPLQLTLAMLQQQSGKAQVGERDYETEYAERLREKEDQEQAPRSEDSDDEKDQQSAAEQKKPDKRSTPASRRPKRRKTSY